MPATISAIDASLGGTFQKEFNISDFELIQQGFNREFFGDEYFEPGFAQREGIIGNIDELDEALANPVSFYEKKSKGYVYGISNFKLNRNRTFFTQPVLTVEKMIRDAKRGRRGR